MVSPEKDLICATLPYFSRVSCTKYVNATSFKTKVERKARLIKTILLMLRTKLPISQIFYELSPDKISLIKTDYLKSFQKNVQFACPNRQPSIHAADN